MNTEHLHICPNCKSEKVKEENVTHTFDYGAGESVPLTVTHPIMTCLDCDESWSDYRGEEARDNCVDQYRRVMSAPIQAQLDIANKRLKSYEAWELSINEALNSGDGSYRP